MQVAQGTLFLLLHPIIFGVRPASENVLAGGSTFSMAQDCEPWWGCLVGGGLCLKTPQWSMETLGPCEEGLIPLGFPAVASHLLTDLLLCALLRTCLSSHSCGQQPLRGLPGKQREVSGRGLSRSLVVPSTRPSRSVLVAPSSWLCPQDGMWGKWPPTDVPEESQLWGPAPSHCPGGLQPHICLPEAFSSRLV